MRVEQGRVRERLRRLHGAQTRTVERRRHQPLRIDELHRVGDRQRRDRGAMGAGGRDGAAHQRIGNERPCGVMHQHDLRGAALKRLEARAHRALPGRRTRYGRREAEPCGRGRETGGVVRVDHRLDQVHFGMRRERAQAVAHDRRAVQRSVLLGIGHARARSAPGRNDDRCHPDGHARPRFPSPTA